MRPMIRIIGDFYHQIPQALYQIILIVIFHKQQKTINSRPPIVNDYKSSTYSKQKEH